MKTRLESCTMIHAQALNSLIGVFRMYVRTDGRMTPSPEIMNHFSSLCFGLYFGVDQFWVRTRTEGVTNSIIRYKGHVFILRPSLVGQDSNENTYKPLPIMPFQYKVYLGVRTWTYRHHGIKSIPLGLSQNPNCSSTITIEECFALSDFEKWARTDDMCENSDHYRRVGRVDYSTYATSWTWSPRVALIMMYSTLAKAIKRCSLLMRWPSCLCQSDSRKLTTKVFFGESVSGRVE